MRHLLLLPTLLLVGLFFLVPLIFTAFYSFGTTSLVSYTTHFGWTLLNYRSLADPLYLGTIVRSLMLSAGATLACVVIAVPMAYFIVQQRRGVQTILLLAVIVPFWTSFLIRIYADQHPENGGTSRDPATRRPGGRPPERPLSRRSRSALHRLRLPPVDVSRSTWRWSGLIPRAEAAADLSRG
jgi:hypothetical protein